MAISENLLHRLKDNDPGFEELDLSDQVDSEDDVELLCDALKNNTHLKRLIIKGDWRNSGKITVTDASAIRLSKCNFEYLDISNNPISSKVAESLALSHSLKELNFCHCQIGVKGLFKFYDSQSLIKLVEIGNKPPMEEYNELSDEEFKDLLQIALKYHDKNHSEIDRRTLNIPDNLLVDAALQDDLEAKVGILSFFNTYLGSGYVIENIKFGDIRPFILEAIYRRVWCKTIDYHLENNKAKNNFLFQNELGRQRSKKALEGLVMKSIETADFASLREKIPELTDDVNTFLVGPECNLLQYSMDCNQVPVALFLIKHGALVEAHYREKTLLFEAAEEGKLEFVKLLLSRGANITGEFDFNNETALSIAAFKMNALTRDLITEYKPIIEQLPDRLKARINSHGRIKYKENGRPYPVPNWLEHAEHESLLYDASYNSLTAITHISKKVGANANENLIKAQQYASIYRLIHDKWAILKKHKPLLNKQRYFEAFEGENPYRLETLIKLPPKKSPFDAVSLDQVLVQLNAELQQQKEMDIDWSQYPSLFIAQYRCIHYYSHIFDENQRLDHITTSHLGRAGASVAVYNMSSLSPIEHQLARESTITKNAVFLRVLFQRFFETGPYEHDGKTYLSVGHYLQERMSNYYKSYMQDIVNRKNPAYEILNDIGAMGYPYFASSDFVDHCLRYGYGLKSVGSFLQHLLKPNYSSAGIPKNPILGKVFIGLYTPLEMATLRMRHATEMYNKEEINLRVEVAPERETGIAGGMEAGYVFYEEYLEVPDFSTWQDEFSQKFGINRSKFDNFKQKLSQAQHTERIEKEIIDLVKVHKEKQILRVAKEEAHRRGGYLIYRPADRTYDVKPHPIRGYSAIFNKEKTLLNTETNYSTTGFFSNELKRSPDSELTNERPEKKHRDMKG